MAAGAFVLYNKAKKKIGNGTIVLGTSPTYLKLCTAAASCSVNLTKSLLSSVTPQISVRGGYTDGGEALGTLAWTVGSTATKYKFDAADLVITASGSSLINVCYAVLGASVSGTGVHALCFSKLSTSQFTVTSPNTLTIVFNAKGIFELS